jgi:hypothetical protein
MKESINGKMLIVTGPESTATRLFTAVLSQHPDICGTEDSHTHVDRFDEVWRALQAGKNQGAVQLESYKGRSTYLLTRRSIPHAENRHVSAEYMHFPDFKSFCRICKEAKIEPVFLITTRSVIPNLVSWACERGSVNGSFKKAKQQYMKAYIHIFDTISAYGLSYYFLSLESLMYETQNYIASIFKLLQLSDHTVTFDPRIDVNNRRYDMFLRNAWPVSGCINRTIKGVKKLKQFFPF